MERPASTTCGECNRAVYVTDVNKNGICVLCEAQPHVPTAPELEDLFRPADVDSLPAA